MNAIQICSFRIIVGLAAYPIAHIKDLEEEKLIQDKLVRATAVKQEKCLNSTQISQWREQGYTFVNGLMNPASIDALANAATKHYQQPGSDEAAKITDFGSTGAMNFPSQVTSLNQVTLDESLLQAVAELLDESVADIRLSQSDVWDATIHYIPR